MSIFKEIKYLTFPQLTRYMLRFFGVNKDKSKLLDRFLFQVAGYVKKNKIKASLFSPVLDVPLSINDKNIHLKLRKNASDWEVFNQIFLEEEYRSSIEIIERKLELSHIKTIIDAGANIGCSVLYFKNHFPHSKILAFEPFEKTFTVLTENLKPLRNDIQLFRKGLWSSSTHLTFDRSFRDGKDWSVQTVESENGTIMGITLSDILHGNKLMEIDILKMDIEGSEFEVLLKSEKNACPLEKVKSIIIEIHDDQGNRQEIYDKLRSNNFEIFELGELTLFLNQAYLKK